jgi:acetyl esterase/lipase
MSPLPPPGAGRGGGRAGGARGGGPGTAGARPGFAPADTSTSIVIRPDPADQIRCGRADPRAVGDVAFGHPALTDGSTIDLLMDILTPTTPGRKPLVVYVPGGGFRNADKRQALNLRTYVAEAGVVVASVHYRTIQNGGNYHDSVVDVKSAIRFLRAHASEYGIDPAKVSVWGESAGGYVASMVGLTNGIKAFDQGDNLNQRSDVWAVVDKFGPSDVAPYEDYGKNRNGSTGDLGGNPLAYVKAANPSFLIFHGTQDQLVSPNETLAVHNALRSAGVTSTRYVLEGAGHGDLSFMGDFNAGIPWSTRQVMNLIVNFVQSPIDKSAK